VNFTYQRNGFNVDVSLSSDTISTRTITGRSCESVQDIVNSDIGESWVIIMIIIDVYCIRYGINRSDSHYRETISHSLMDSRIRVSHKTGKFALQTTRRFNSAWMCLAAFSQLPASISWSSISFPSTCRSFFSLRYDAHYDPPAIEKNSLEESELFRTNFLQTRDFWNYFTTFLPKVVNIS